MKHSAKLLIVSCVLLLSAFSLAGCRENIYINPHTDKQKPKRPELDQTTSNDILENTKVILSNNALLVRYGKDLEDYIDYILK